MKAGRKHINIQKYFIVILVSCFISAGFCFSVKAQNAPVTTASILGNVVPGQQVTIEIKVTGFTNIGSISLSMDYDFSTMQFISATINPQLINAGNFAAGDHDRGNGVHEVVSGWYGNGVTLPDGSTILTYIFTYVSGSSLMQWFDNGASCAYTDNTGTFLNDIPFSSYYKNVIVCGTLTDPGPISGASAVCLGTTGVVYNIIAIPAAIRYVWSVPSGSVIVSGSDSNEIIVDFPANSVSGNITVRAENGCGPGNTASIPVSVSQLPMANAGSDTTIWAGTDASLHGIARGAPMTGFQWSPENLLIDPTVLDPRTIGLDVTTTFTLKVTNLVNLCTSTDQVIVTVNDVITGIDGTNNTTELNDKDIYIFPNPADDYFVVRQKNSFGSDIKCSIYSMNGTEVYNSGNNIGCSGNELHIDVSNLKAGIYFTKINNGIENVIRKLVIF